MVAEPGGPGERVVELSIKAGEGLLVELKVKGSITELISRLLGETSSETRQNACFDEETSEADTAKHTSILETAVSRSTLDSEDSSQYRTLQCTAEQILDVPVPETMKQLVEMPEMVTQLGEVPNTVSQDRIKQRTVEHISEIPVPQVVEELAEISKVFSLDGVQQRFGGQIIETPALSLDEKIVEMPVTQKTQQVANTHVQHVANTVEAEMLKIIEETVQRMKPINQETKRIEVPPLLFTDKAVDVPVVAQRQVSRVCVVKQTVEDPQFEIVQKTVENPETVPQMQAVEETTEIPQSRVADKVVDVPVVLVVQAPQVQVSEKTVQISQLQAVEKIVETRETQMVHSIQTFESSDTAPVPQVHAIGVVKPDEPEVGSFIFDAHGNRVANELGERDFVTGEMWENKPPFSLASNNAVSDDRQCKHYTGRRVRKLHEYCLQ